jgi:G patch domain-containing protein 1
MHIPRTEPYIAKAALLGFQPFVNDPVMQERYTTYLNSQSHVDGSYPSLRPYPGQSIEHFNKEVSDFAKSAAVFKPLSGAMAGRFTSAATVELGPVAQEGLYQPTFKEGEDKAPKEEEKVEEKVDQDPRANAAQMGMYGPMTRTVSKWAPARLLCKRFGVKDPHPEADPEEDVPAPSASNATASAPIAAITLSETQMPDEVTSYPEEGDIKKPSRSRDLSNIGLGEDEYQAQDVLTYQRPSMDVFKAIFASDDEDSDDENADTAGKPAPIGPNPTPDLTTNPPAAPVSDASTSLTSDARKVAESTPNPVLESGPVDLSTFKPTFVSRTDRGGRKEDPGKAKERKKKEKTLVSFDADDGEDSGLGAPKPKKRKDKDKHKDKDKDREKKRKKAVTEDEDDMWVEKPPPEAVINMATTPDEVKRASELTKTRGRPTAADFM